MGHLDQAGKSNQSKAIMCYRQRFVQQKHAWLCDMELYTCLCSLWYTLKKVQRAQKGYSSETQSEWTFTCLSVCLKNSLLAHVGPSSAIWGSWTEPGITDFFFMSGFQTACNGTYVRPVLGLFAAMLGHCWAICGYVGGQARARVGWLTKFQHRTTNNGIVYRILFLRKVKVVELYQSRPGGLGITKLPNPCGLVRLEVLNPHWVWPVYWSNPGPCILSKETMYANTWKEIPLDSFEKKSLIARYSKTESTHM